MKRRSQRAAAAQEREHLERVVVPSGDATEVDWPAIVRRKYDEHLLPHPRRLDRHGVISDRLVCKVDCSGSASKASLVCTETPTSTCVGCF